MGNKPTLLANGEYNIDQGQHVVQYVKQATAEIVISKMLEKFSGCKRKSFQSNSTEQKTTLYRGWLL